MKRFLVLFAAILVIFSLSSCSKKYGDIIVKVEKNGTCSYWEIAEKNFLEEFPSETTDITKNAEVKFEVKKLNEPVSFKRGSNNEFTFTHLVNVHYHTFYYSELYNDWLYYETDKKYLMNEDYYTYISTNISTQIYKFEK